MTDTILFANATIENVMNKSTILHSFAKAAQNKPITLERKLALKTTGDKITPAQL
jgi:hypothetical protein